jgi:hypothetical protein
MDPLKITSNIGNEKIEEILDELNSGQFKRVLNAGDIPTRVPSRIVSLKKRAKIWKDRLIKALDEENFFIAQSLIYEWLLHKRRPMLSNYLDRINVNHRNGETDETFLKTVPEEVLRDRAKELSSDFNNQDVAIYVHFLDFHQKTKVFSDDEHFMKTLQNG